MEDHARYVAMHSGFFAHDVALRLDHGTPCTTRVRCHDVIYTHSVHCPFLDHFPERVESRVTRRLVEVLKRLRVPASVFAAVVTALRRHSLDCDSVVSCTRTCMHSCPR